FLAKGIKHPLRGNYRPIQNRVPSEATSSSKIENSQWLELTGINYRNLKDQVLRLPPGRLIMACGPSGAGKST
ncbi:hypothetical protein, partial [Klebsiella pneumoniae]|uniref:hypothetical protein n=1 Tax=Klebsiella pneumoniae TaxID=573 RepID=UPI001D0E47F2